MNENPAELLQDIWLRYGLPQEHLEEYLKRLNTQVESLALEYARGAHRPPWRLGE